MVIFLILVIILGVFILLHESFKTYSNMNYIEHLEKMGVFVDENGKEI